MLPEAGFYTTRGRRIARLRGKVGLCFVAALSFLAGMTDAVGFAATGDFVSFMSGNTTRLAISISQGNAHAIITIATLIGAFIAGNALGVIFARLAGRRSWPLLAGVAALLALAGLMPSSLSPLVCAVVSMGIINAVVEEVNGLPIGLTYVTGALSRFGRGFGRWLMGERRPGWRVQLVPWFGMLLGAVTGAFIQARFGIAALAVNGLVAAGLAVASLLIPRRWQMGYMR